MFCQNCGKEYPQTEAVCPDCGMPRGEGSGYCPRCGVKATGDSVYCTNCGAPLDASRTTASAPQYAGAQPTAAPPMSQPVRKSKLAAVLLAFFLGGLGIHNFYLGYTGKALGQLALGLLSCGFISWIWAVIEAIMILCGSIATDGNGVPLGD